MAVPRRRCRTSCCWSPCIAVFRLRSKPTRSQRSSSAGPPHRGTTTSIAGSRAGFAIAFARAVSNDSLAPRVDIAISGLSISRFAATSLKMSTAADTASTTQPFQAEVSELLHLMVHSVYSETDIFLRELISNASDACDKLRYEAIASPALLGEEGLPKIRIIPDKANNTLTIADTGIGMDRQELIDNLGTIARSGTKSFVSRLKEAKDGIGLIGQFGVGFYSAFMVADRITVLSRRAGTEEVWSWSSEGGSGFEIAPTDKDG